MVVFVISDEWYEFVGWSGEGLSSALGLDSSDLVVAAREDFRNDGERPVPEFRVSSFTKTSSPVESWWPGRIHFERWEQEAR